MERIKKRFFLDFDVEWACNYFLYVWDTVECRNQEMCDLRLLLYAQDGFSDAFVEKLRVWFEYRLRQAVNRDIGYCQAGMRERWDKNGKKKRLVVDENSLKPLFSYDHEELKEALKG